MVILGLGNTKLNCVSAYASTFVTMLPVVISAACVLFQLEEGTGRLRGLYMVFSRSSYHTFMVDSQRMKLKYVANC